MAGHVACMGYFRNDMLFRSEELNVRESSSFSVVHNSMEEIIWGPTHGWKILTSCYIRCHVPDGTDLADTPQYPHCVVLNETWRQLYFI
jgi:hypothetical protein